MNENIGVGIIVGLAIGSSTYIWNSDNFTKSQKYILLLFILFPPLQWISAIILCIYNKQQFQKTNFVPYIIIALLSIILISVINWDNVLQKINIDSYNQENGSVEPATDISTSSYDSSNQMNSADANNIYQKKFAYVLIKIKTPKLDLYEFEGVYTVDENINRHEEIPARTIYSTKWEESDYSTDVMEIENYNEDEKYRMLDKAENNISLQHNLSSSDMNFRLEIDARCKDNAERERLKENKSQITNSEVYVFDSYAEASQHKRENTTTN
jgi:hypothetical protein